MKFISKYAHALKLIGFVGIIIVPLLLSTGCAGVKTRKEAISPAPVVYDESLDPATVWPDEKMEEAFRKYWAYRFADDTSALLFEMEAPYVQEMVDEERYYSYIKGNWRSKLIEIRIRNIKPESENLFLVETEIWVEAPTGETKNMFLIDGWVKARDEWYHVLKDLLFFPGL